jgi:hypothetical protein
MGLMRQSSEPPNPTGRNPLHAASLRSLSRRADLRVVVAVLLVWGAFGGFNLREYRAGIAAGHGGRLLVESTLGRGSRFDILLPVVGAAGEFQVEAA